MPQPFEGEEGPIESLTRKLYTPGDDAVPKIRRAGLHADRPDVPSDWQHEHATARPLTMSLAKHHKTAKWIFGVAVTFFIASLGAALFFLTDNRNIISAEKIDLSVIGPVSVAAGDTLPLSIDIVNRNTATLEIADLIVEYPQGTRSTEDVTRELTDYRVGLGDIASGDRISTTTKAILFGEEGSTRDIVITLEYRIAGSNAIFVKESVFTVSIGTAPLSLDVDGPRSVNSGDEVELELTIRSNSSIPMENVVIRAEYPFGFEFESSDPETSFSDTVWALGDIEPEGERQIQITGTLEGQHDEDRIFRFDVGVASRDDTTTIGTTFVRAEHEMTIDRPFVDLSLKLNGSTEETVIGSPGSTVRGELSWRNNLPAKLGDAVIEIELDGTAYVESSVSALNGFYDSGRNVILWDQQGVDDLEVIDPGSSGTVTFTFALKPPGGVSGAPEVPVTARLVATPVGSDRTPEEVESVLSRRIVLPSNVGLSADAFHTSGPFDNSGPIPPRVEEETTYTITWEVTNSGNDLSDAMVRAVLPPYVSWKDDFTPQSEDVSYTASSREIRWDVGDVESGSGTRRMSFQIGLTPSVTQVGSAPVLVETATLFATDTFIGGEVGATTQPVTTTLSDSTMPGHDRVVE